MKPSPNAWGLYIHQAPYDEKWEPNREDVLNTTPQESVVISIRVKLYLGEKKESVCGFINLSPGTLGDVKPGSDPRGWHRGSISIPFFKASKKKKQVITPGTNTPEPRGLKHLEEAGGVAGL